MAKVTGPLHSDTASGTFNDTLTYDKRGYVRVRVIPANPQTAAQGDVRQKLLAVQKALSVIGATPIAQLKLLAPISYRWNSFALQQAVGPLSANYDAYMATYAALTGGQKTSWEGEGATAGLVDQHVVYATDAAVTDGAALFIISSMLFALGIHTAGDVPSSTNFAGWGEYFVS
jgi:hypothetical protein